MIHDAYGCWYVVPTAYACMVMSYNSRRGDAGSVLYGSAPGLYDFTDCVLLSGCVQLQLRVQLWSVNQRAMETEESPLARFITRKHLVKTLQRNSHCGEL
jgi:hypothetical protein